MSTPKNAINIVLNVLHCLFLVFLAIYILTLMPTLVVAAHVLGWVAISIETILLASALGLSCHLLAKQVKKLSTHSSP
jgi:hypothetical protein